MSVEAMASAMVMSEKFSPSLYRSVRQCSGKAVGGALLRSRQDPACEFADRGPGGGEAVRFFRSDSLQQGRPWHIPTSRFI